MVIIEIHEFEALRASWWISAIQEDQDKSKSLLKGK